MDIAILGAGITGCCLALRLAKLGVKVHLYDKAPLPMQGASLYNEGKLHLGYVYAADPTRQTHHLMVEGSQSFIRELATLTDLPESWFMRSKAFIYAVPKDSQLSFTEICQHAQQVDELAKRHSVVHHTSSALQLLGLNSQELLGAISTQEICVDPAQVASALIAVVMSEPLIVKKLGCTLKDVSKLDAGFNLTYHDQAGAIQQERYSLVVNCLWEQRLHFDKQLGFLNNKPTLNRFKLSVQFATNSQKTIPSTTLITGPYGDVVNHGQGRFYLSWYPICKIGETQSTEPNELANLENLQCFCDKQQIIQDTVKHLSRFVPALAELNFSKPPFVAGGFICSWGKTDIDDPQSELHQRHHIGLHCYGNWLSIDTGKYCTGPLFAKQAFDYIKNILGSAI
ncbi:NAD(P)/FAD-dependent oxidoreductase [Alishewanella tabrizica]|uniref:FAD dependent oxidoreductase domain-containing protein n=1 Tax=Alishewanella tabrizica TaxID=671278 RepID=A0ABQ2WBD9_9ALTE|nr:FAD-dependent oxidoreductase [Alishewanella tabrizica]GGW48437.1 hypothetical protein GCM10008111_00040 [Alishewanella tabrizica]